MRAFCKGLIIAAAFATLVGLGGTARAQLYEFQYQVDGGAVQTVNLLGISGNTTTSATDSVTPIAGLTIVVSTTSNNPGAANGAELFNATTNTVNATGSQHTVVVSISETNYTQPTGSGNLTAAVNSVTVAKTSSLNGTVASATFSNVTASLDGTNTVFGTQHSTNSYSAGPLTQSGNGTTPGPDGSLAYAGNPFTPGNPFSMTVFNTITVGANTSATLKENAVFTAVPEPSTMAIAGLGALGMIGYGLRRRKALGA